MHKFNFFLTDEGFSELEIEKISSYFSQVQLEKGTLFVNEGKISLQMAFIEIGKFQYFSIDDQANERTTYISIENTFVASILSYLNEIPARENIRAIVTSNIWVINKHDVVVLRKEIPRFNDFYIKILEYQLCCIDKSRIDFITLSAEERYHQLVAQDPHFLQEVPLQYIASMLGITPRHLSRIRGKF